MDSRPPPDFTSLLGRLSRALGDRDVRFMLIGGQAVLLHKLFAGRARDLEDAESVVRRKGADLDWDYLERWAREFAAIPGREDLPERVDALRRG